MEDSSNIYLVREENLAEELKKITSEDDGLFLWDVRKTDSSLWDFSRQMEETAETILNGGYKGVLLISSADVYGRNHSVEEGEGENRYGYLDFLSSRDERAYSLRVVEFTCAQLMQKMKLKLKIVRVIPEDFGSKTPAE